MRNRTYLYASLLIITSFVIGASRSYRVRHDVSIYNAGDTDISFVTTKTKSYWVLSQLIKYNSHHTKLIVKPVYVEPHDAMVSITTDKLKASVWNPDSEFWVYRANELWIKQHNEPLINVEDPFSYRITARSPLVYVTTKNKAEYLQQILSGSNSWELLYNRFKNPQLKAYKYAIADPQNTSSGILTIALITDEYSRLHNITNKQNLLTDIDFKRYLTVLKKQAIIYRNIMGQQNNIVADINNDKYDFIVVRENVAILAARDNPALKIIYPTPTVTSQEAVCTIQGSWMTEKQHTIAKQFIQLISNRESSHDAELNFLRPADGPIGANFKKVISKLRNQGLQEDYMTISPPSYQLLNNIVYLWASNIHEHEGAQARLTPNIHEREGAQTRLTSVGPVPITKSKINTSLSLRFGEKRLHSYGVERLSSRNKSAEGRNDGS